MVRIQLELPEERVAELDRLMAEANIRTRKDLFNNALTLFEWAAKEKKAGRTIASIDEGEKTYKELIMPALESATSARQSAKTAARTGEALASKGRS